ncbi:3-oxoacyl-ACP synthase III family protein [Streptomyces sp. NPDC051664]|uniref:3-oxoacyl-ACP synthase III family protein n=1 Tax=Streptomyces sp. NPDC051664 TaxID=3365668 RepID=UPI0037BE1A61
MNFGIVEFGYAFGETLEVARVAGDFVTDPERVIRLGYKTFHRASGDVWAVDLAEQAAQDALKRAGLTPADLDLVVLATSEHPEYPHWDSSAALARELGIPRVQTLLLNEGCASGVTGLGVVAGQYAVQTGLNRVLFVAVNRVSEFHRNRMNVNNAVHSDGAVAVLLERGHAGHQWVSTAQFTVPELCDFFRTDYGGSVAPLPPLSWTSLTAPAGIQRVQQHFGRDPRRLQAFVQDLLDRVGEVIDEACEQGGVRRADLARVIYINDGQESMQEIADALGVAVERTNVELASVHGHMGAADQLTSLGEHIGRGELVEGDLVALCGISIGMRWYCTLIRI